MSESKEVTNKRLGSVSTEDTAPEKVVQGLLERMEVEFELHREDLPGTPDVVVPDSKLVVFVHGCFWHQHEGCDLASTPKKNLEYWKPKFERNKERDAENEEALKGDGWRVATVWECQTRNAEELLGTLENLVNRGGD